MAYKKIDGIIDTKLKVMKTTGAAGEAWTDTGNYLQNDETGGLSLRTGVGGALQNIQVADPTATTDSATKDYVDANAGGSVATTEQVVIVNFDKGDYNGVVTNPTGNTQYAVMSSSFQIPDGSYVTGCGVWVDPADPWPATAEIIVGDVTTPEPAGPPPAPAGNVMPDRWMDKTSNAASTGGVYFKANWDRLTDNTAKTIFVCIAAAENAQLLTGNCQVFLKYVETPRT